MQLTNGLAVVLVVRERPECARHVCLHLGVPVKHRDEWLEAAHFGDGHLVLEAVVRHRPKRCRHVLLHESDVERRVERRS